MNPKSILAAVAIATTLFALPSHAQEAPMESTVDPIQLIENFPAPDEDGTVNVNGLEMYYQVHGEGEPLVLIHGGLMTIEAWGPFLSALAETRKVYAIELEGHGRTVDLDRPLSIRQFADDVGGFIDAMDIGPVDIVGYSMGGGTATGVAILHPDQVKSIVVISAAYQSDSIWDSVRAGWPYMTAEMMEGTPMKVAYDAVAPQPERFAGFIDKIRESMTVEGDVWTEDEIAAITAPVLMMIGDHDLIQLDKALEMYRLLGGQASTGPMGPDLNPDRQFSVIPAATHYDIYFKTDLVMPVITAFLDAQSGL
ncbi:alpha/beta fold hydrolase [Pelagibacterium luteolum]|uniref:Pimeloyl-ACP methyl ester carboxylesterase n=1 Tax=Pelagibacterium luteolum TaxID=440168 RepID=A0A1G7TL74_9HYPH|nr:alpha/beta hydrolase [Pelagibacterium luteolum]SDG36093.1 Pimeloyl-ACP methyl ester carboxylesterase [Pelagibacterium luteolum]